jgi:hypothetical protein
LAVILSLRLQLSSKAFQPVAEYATRRCRRDAIRNPLAAGFVVPAQPVKASKPPVGTERVHEIKHDGYELSCAGTAPSHGSTAATRCATVGDRGCRRADQSQEFTIDGEAVLGPDGLSLFDELRRRGAARAAILYAFDLTGQMVRICAISHSWTARRRRRDCCATLRQVS